MHESAYWRGKCLCSSMKSISHVSQVFLFWWGWSIAPQEWIEPIDSCCARKTIGRIQEFKQFLVFYLFTWYADSTCGRHTICTFFCILAYAFVIEWNRERLKNLKESVSHSATGSHEVKQRLRRSKKKICNAKQHKGRQRIQDWHQSHVCCWSLYCYALHIFSSEVMNQLAQENIFLS